MANPTQYTGSDGRFKPGNPGKPKGATSKCGRTRALAVLDSVLCREDVQNRLREALVDFILDDPVKAFQQIIMPLLPKQANIAIEFQKLFGKEAPTDAV